MLVFQVGMGFNAGTYLVDLRVAGGVAFTFGIINAVDSRQLFFKRAGVIQLFLDSLVEVLF